MLGIIGTQFLKGTSVREANFTKLGIVRIVLTMNLTIIPMVYEFTKIIYEH